MSRLTYAGIMALLAGCTGLELDEPSTSTTTEEIAFIARWPSSTVYFYIDTTGKTYPHQSHCDMAAGAPVATPSLVYDAIDLYRTQTPLQFKELTSLPSSFDGRTILVFTQGTASNPKSGGTPDGTSSDYLGCLYIPASTSAAHTIEHEMGHGFGMIHEQSRSDRDDTLTYDSTCVDDDFKHDFAKVNSRNLTPYDLDSIMEYSSTEFCQTADEKPSCRDANDKCTRPPLMINGCTDRTNPACTFGKASGLSQLDITGLYSRYNVALGGNEQNDQLGAAMAAGDFDGDGYGDLAVGAPGEAPGSSPHTGAVFLYKGTEQGLVPWKVLALKDFVPAGAVESGGEQFGAALAAGDVDGDGAADLFVGAPGYNGTGGVFRYTSNTAVNKRTGLQPAYVINDPSLSPNGNQFGTAIAVGRYDGTHMGVLIGAPNASTSPLGVRTGVAFLQRSDGSFARIMFPGGTASTRFGAAVALGHVVTNDGVKLAVGAPGAVGGGQVIVYYGTSLTTMATIKAPAPGTNDYFGAAIVIDRVSTQATDEVVVVGAPRSPFSFPGGLVTISRITTPFPPAQPFVTRLETLAASDVGLQSSYSDRFGAALAVGDIDGNGSGGKHSLVIGAPGANQAAFRSGTQWWKVAESTLDRLPVSTNDQFGSALACGMFGDIHTNLDAINDPLADCAFGAPARAPTAKPNAGGFQVWMGVDNGFGMVFTNGFDQTTTIYN